MRRCAAERLPTDWGDVDKLGPHHISTLPRYWITRLYVGLTTLCAIFVTSHEPEAISYKIIQASGDQGWRMVYLLGVIAGLAVVDVLVNDLFPERFKIEVAKRNRHLIYIGLATGIFSISFVLLSDAGGWYRPLVLSYWLHGSVAALVAFLDLFQRHRGKERAPQ